MCIMFCIVLTFFPRRVVPNPEPSISLNFDSISFVNPFRGEVAWHLTQRLKLLNGSYSLHSDIYPYLPGDSLLSLTSCVTEQCYYPVLVLNPSLPNWINTRALITKNKKKTAIEQCDMKVVSGKKIKRSWAKNEFTDSPMTHKKDQWPVIKKRFFFKKDDYLARNV